MSRALVLVAEGSEETEVIITANVLRRAGVKTVLAGLLGPEIVAGARGLKLVPDVALADAQGPWDAIVLPGGMAGAEAFAASPAVGQLLRDAETQGIVVAAVCAAPIALVAHGVFAGRTLTSYPSVRERVEAHGTWIAADAVEHEGLITGSGPGTCFEFALTLVESLRGSDVADSVRADLLIEPQE